MFKQQKTEQYEQIKTVSCPIPRSARNNVLRDSSRIQAIFCGFVPVMLRRVGEMASSLLKLLWLTNNRQ
jgi:hypothetical protein